MRDLYRRFVRLGRRRPPSDPGQEPELIPPALAEEVRAAFPRPEVTDALRSRVAGLCRDAAAPGALDRRPDRWNRRMLMRTARWGSLGLAATALAIVWMSGRSSSDVLAATIHAMEAVPVIHVVSTGDRGGHGEVWVVDGVGSYIHSVGREDQTFDVDDLTNEYRYYIPNHPGPASPTPEARVEVLPSQMADPKQAERIWASHRGTELLKALQAQKKGKKIRVDEVTLDGRRVRRIRSPGYHWDEVVYVDLTTDRILRTESEGPDVLTAPERITFVYDYPSPATVDRSRFHFEVPARVSVEDHTIGPIHWAQGDVATCLNQLRTLEEALRRYANDHHGQWPDALRPALNPYVESPAIFRCPRAPAGNGSSYEYHRPGELLAPRVLALWNRRGSNPAAMEDRDQSTRLGQMRPGLIECHLHGDQVLRLSHGGYLVRFTQSPQPPASSPAAVPTPTVPTDPRVTAVLKALAVRDRRLSEIQVTYDYRAEYLLPLITWQGQLYPGQQDQGPGEFIRHRTTWARKGRRSLYDETSLSHDKIPAQRRRVVGDGEMALAQYASPANRPLESPQAESRDSSLQGTGEIGISHGSAYFADLLKAGGTIRYLGSRVIGGSRCVGLEGTDPRQRGARSQFWFDPAHGYALRQSREAGAEGHLFLTVTASAPREWAPGVFLSTRLNSLGYFWNEKTRPANEDRAPTPTHRYTAVVRQVKVGGLPDVLFQPVPTR
jgi:hypothetical protein